MRTVLMKKLFQTIMTLNLGNLPLTGILVGCTVLYKALESLPPFFENYGYPGSPVSAYERFIETPLVVTQNATSENENTGMEIQESVEDDVLQDEDNENAILQSMGFVPPLIIRDYPEANLSQFISAEYLENDLPQMTISEVLENGITCTVVRDNLEHGAPELVFPNEGSAIRASSANALLQDAKTYNCYVEDFKTVFAVEEMDPKVWYRCVSGQIHESWSCSENEAIWFFRKYSNVCGFGSNPLVDKKFLKKEIDKVQLRQAEAIWTGASESEYDKGHLEYLNNLLQYSCNILSCLESIGRIFKDGLENMRSHFSDDEAQNNDETFVYRYPGRPILPIRTASGGFAIPAPLFEDIQDMVLHGEPIPLYQCPFCLSCPQLLINCNERTGVCSSCPEHGRDITDRRCCTFDVSTDFPNRSPRTLILSPPPPPPPPPLLANLNELNDTDLEENNYPSTSPELLHEEQEHSEALSSLNSEMSQNILVNGSPPSNTSRRSRRSSEESREKTEIRENLLESANMLDSLRSPSLSRYNSEFSGSPDSSVVNMHGSLASYEVSKDNSFDSPKSSCNAEDFDQCSNSMQRFSQSPKSEESRRFRELSSTVSSQKYGASPESAEFAENLPENSPTLLKNISTCPEDHEPGKKLPFKNSESHNYSMESSNPRSHRFSQSNSPASNHSSEAPRSPESHKSSKGSKNSESGHSSRASKSSESPRSSKASKSPESGHSSRASKSSESRRSSSASKGRELSGHSSRASKSSESRRFSNASKSPESGHSSRASKSSDSPRSSSASISPESGHSFRALKSFDSPRSSKASNSPESHHSFRASKSPQFHDSPKAPESQHSARAARSPESNPSSKALGSSQCHDFFTTSRNTESHHFFKTSSSSSSSESQYSMRNAESHHSCNISRSPESKNFSSASMSSEFEHVSEASRSPEPNQSFESPRCSESRDYFDYSRSKSSSNASESQEDVNSSQRNYAFSEPRDLEFIPILNVERRRLHPSSIASDHRYQNGNASKRRKLTNGDERQPYKSGEESESDMDVIDVPVQGSTDESNVSSDAETLATSPLNDFRFRFETDTNRVTPSLRSPEYGSIYSPEAGLQNGTHNNHNNIYGAHNHTHNASPSSNNTGSLLHFLDFDNIEEESEDDELLAEQQEHEESDLDHWDFFPQMQHRQIVFEDSADDNDSLVEPYPLPVVRFGFDPNPGIGAEQLLDLHIHATVTLEEEEMQRLIWRNRPDDYEDSR